jgi:hypothetical protein
MSSAGPNGNGNAIIPANPVAKPVESAAPVEFMAGKNGGKLKRGGTIGPGRPKDDWKAQCASLATRGAKAVAARQVIENPDHPVFLGAWKFAAEQAHGKAQASVDLTTGGRPFLIVPDIE